MLCDFMPIDPFFLVSLEHSCNKINKLFRSCVLIRKLEQAGLHVLAIILNRVESTRTVVEWVDAFECHTVKNNSKWKHIDFSRANFRKIQFWSHIERSSLTRQINIDFDVSWVDKFGESEICNLECPTIDQDILRFDIAVNHSDVVEYFVALTELLSEILNLFLTELIFVPNHILF